MTPANLVSPVARIAAAVTATATVTATRSNTTRSTSSRGSSSLLARSLRARERSLEATDHFPREPLFISLPRTIANPFGCLAGSSIHDQPRFSTSFSFQKEPSLDHSFVQGGNKKKNERNERRLSRGESAGDPDRKTLGERERDGRAAASRSYGRKGEPTCCGRRGGGEEEDEQSEKEQDPPVIRYRAARAPVRWFIGRELRANLRLPIKARDFERSSVATKSSCYFVERV